MKAVFHWKPDIFNAVDIDVRMFKKCIDDDTKVRIEFSDGMLRVHTDGPIRVEGSEECLAILHDKDPDAT